jgi:putative tricarboxylic transport membrane protein
VEISTSIYTEIVIKLGMTELFAVLTGIFAGIVTGVIPGAGVLVAMIIATPLLMGFDIVQLLLFYMSLASMVQFTGTIPAVYLGIPGETNSLPAVVEGTKFTKRAKAKLAIGISALGSVIGSVMAVIITFLLISILIDHVSVFFANTLKFYLYMTIILFCLTVYNRGNMVLNALLCVFGFALSVPGESDIAQGFRYTFGIEDLQFGFPLITVLIGLLIVPTVFSMLKYDIKRNLDSDKDISFRYTILYFIRKCIPSSLRGGLIGYLCGFVPGVSTVLATNASYSIEKRMSKRTPARLLVSSETANNSGQFASMLPLLLIGIPITGSEVVLYSLLVDAGWSPFQFDRVELNAEMIYKTIVPWFVFANVIGLLVAWPLARKMLAILSFPRQYMVAVLAVVMLLLNSYLGYLDYRFWFYSVCLIVFGMAGYFLRKYETIPLIFMFILGNEIEGVFFRQWLT